MCFFFILVSIVSGRGKRSPGIEFLGSGYDIMQGNPRSPHVGGDPGWKLRPIFQLTYKERKTTADDRNWDIPDGTNVFDLKTCNTEYDSSIISGGNSYRSRLDESVKSMHGFNFLQMIGFRYTVNKHWKDITESTYKYDSIVAETTATCSVYYANFETTILPIMHEDFMRAISELPSEYNEDVYWNFLTIFGTSVIMEVTLGGYRGEIYNITRQSYRKMQDDGFDVKESAKWSGFGFKGVLDTRTKSQIKMGTEFDNRTTHRFSFNIGGTYSSDERSFLHNSLGNPLPITISLLNITEIMHANFTGGHIIRDLDQKRKNLIMALDNYCSYWAQGPSATQCQSAPPDTPLPQPIPWNGQNLMLVNYDMRDCRIRRGSDGKTWRWCGAYNDEDFWILSVADQSRYPDNVYTIENSKFRGEYLVNTDKRTTIDLIEVRVPDKSLNIPSANNTVMLYIYGTNSRIAFYQETGDNCLNQRSAPECYGAYDGPLHNDQVWILTPHS